MKAKLFLLSFFYLALLSFVCAQQIQDPSAPGQSLSASQLGTINIDNISDDQLKSYMQRAEQSGYSDMEIETALRMRGMPEAEISKLRSRIQKLRAGGVSSGTSFDRARTREQKPVDEDNLIQALTSDYETLKEAEISEKQKRIFGFNLFNSENLTFEPSMNIATPKDYQLGSGDEVIIDIWGASEQTYQLMISPEGDVRIPNIGPVYLNGLSVERASERIKSRLTKIYSGLKPRGGQAANTFAQISLGQLRTIMVNVLGEAIRPGTYNVSSLAGLAHVLYLSGGPSINGSMRNIEIIRDNTIIRTVDVYEFLVEGIIRKTLRLQDRDIVRITPYINRVEVLGEVKREGIYETKEGETFEDLLNFAGGFTENAYKEVIKVRRNTGDQREFLDLSEAEMGSTSVKNGDEVLVQGILNRFSNRVQIQGAVFREGEYQLKPGLTLKQLIESADGLRGDAFTERGTIYRTNEDFSYSIISFNVRKLLKGTAQDIKLQREDMVQISSIYDLKEEFYVKIAGEVKKSGTYPFHHQMTVEDLIVRAGGLRESASGSMVEVARRRTAEQESDIPEVTAEIFNFTIDKELRLLEEDKKFLLEPFDQVFIRKAPGYQQQASVKVEGEVLYPGYYVLMQKDERISDIINRTGGLTNTGYAAGATLIRRTEFNPPKSDEQMRLESLNELLNGIESRFDENEFVIESEAEALQEKRLKSVEKELKEYNTSEDIDVNSEGIRAKRRGLEELLKRDSTLFDNAAIRFETIGIELEKILADPGSKYDLILQEGDVLSVPKQLETVRMRGEFLYPVTVRYDQSLTFKKYVSKAGGFTQDAKRSKSYVLYANGSVDRTKKFLCFTNYPKIGPGAELIVPRKPERRKMSPGEWIGITTGLATIALIVSNLTK